ncbi:MAG: GTP-binding protein [Pseudomonadota bacterium]
MPTNVITGFLGAGKTTAILHLLKGKPADESWAVLVNEFGEIGVDGSLFQGQNQTENNVTIKEVPGGCMCCAAGLPMQIALSMMLGRVKPDRLLIEPTGLGHPLEVLQALSADYNRDLISIHKTVTLVDARQLSDKKYRDHDTFRQQLMIADIVLANKDDLSSAHDREQLSAYVADLCQPETRVLHTQQGQLGLELLTGPTAIDIPQREHVHTLTSQPAIDEYSAFPECGYVSACNEGEGFKSIGWRFSPQKVFDRSRLYGFLSGLDVERMKAVFITTDGVYGYNLTRDALSEIELDDCLESRIEIINNGLNPDWENKLTECLAAEFQDAVQ